MTEEDYLKGILSTLRQEYEKAAQPYVDRLIKIRSTRLETQLLEVTPAQMAHAEAIANYENKN